MKRIFKFWIRGWNNSRQELTLAWEGEPNSSDDFFGDIIIKKDGSVVIWDSGVRLVKKETSRNWRCDFEVDFAIVFTHVKSRGGEALHFSIKEVG